jgi:hypothetical protein
MIVNVSTAILNKALSKSAEFAHIDIQDGGNKCGVFRFKRQLEYFVDGNNTTKKIVHHFLFFPHRKQPTFPKDRQTWIEIYNKSAQFKLASRSKQARCIVVTTMDLVSPPVPPKKR